MAATLCLASRSYEGRRRRDTTAGASLGFANLEKRRVVSAPAVIADRPEFRFGMNSGARGRRRCSPKALADRLICAGEQAQQRGAFVGERAPGRLAAWLPEWTRRGTAMRPTSSWCSPPERKSCPSGQRCLCCRRLDCATPTTRGLVGPIARHDRSPPPKTKAKVSCRSPSNRSCISTTGAIDRCEPSTSLSRSPHPSARGVGTARVLLVSGLLGRRFRNATVAIAAPRAWS